MSCAELNVLSWNGCYMNDATSVINWLYEVMLLHVSYCWSDAACFQSVSKLASLQCVLVRCLLMWIECVMCCCDVRSTAEAADVELSQMSAGNDEPVATSVNGAGLNWFNTDLDSSYCTEWQLLLLDVCVIIITATTPVSYTHLTLPTKRIV